MGLYKRGKRKMKKSLPFLIVGMLLFCGIEAVTSTIDKNESQPKEKLYQPEFRLDVFGLMGLKFHLTNYGNETFKGNISGNVTINDCIVLLRKTKTFPSSYYEINMSDDIKFYHRFLGLGSAIVRADFQIENVALIESESYFFIFLMFAIPYK
jgi:hypothetical protein